VTEIVTRVRPGTTTDRYGADVADWTDPDELDIGGCAVAPRHSGEDTTDGRQGVIIGYTVYAPAGADVLPTDRLVIRGDTHDIDGLPGVWTSPFTATTEGVEIAAKRVDG
jgi:hypothetical protein